MFHIQICSCAMSLFIVPFDKTENALYCKISQWIAKMVSPTKVLTFNMTLTCVLSWKYVNLCVWTLEKLISNICDVKLPFFLHVISQLNLGKMKLFSCFTILNFMHTCIGKDKHVYILEHALFYLVFWHHLVVDIINNRWSDWIALHFSTQIWNLLSVLFELLFFCT